MAEDIIIVEVIESGIDLVICDFESAEAVSVSAGIPGPPGKDGPPGAPADGEPGDFFQTALLFSELDTESKKQTALNNLGLSTVDGGEFFTATP